MSPNNPLDSYHAAVPNEDAAAFPPYSGPALPPIDVEPARRVKRPSSPRTRRNALSVVALIFALLLLAGAGTVYYLDQRFDGRIYPNVSIQGIPVGMLTEPEARAALEARYGAFVRNPATVVLDGQRFQPTLAELGGEFAFDQMVEDAYKSGRGNGLISNLFDLARINRDGLEIPLRVNFDHRVLQGYMANLTANADIAPVDAELKRDGITTTVVPSRTGRQVLLDETVQNLTVAVESLTSQTIEVRMRELRPRLHDNEVNDAKKLIDGYLNGPVSMEGGPQPLIWPPETLAPMIDVSREQRDAQSDTLKVTLNTYPIEVRIREVAQLIKTEPTMPRVIWNDGNPQIARPGEFGKALDEAKANEMAVAAIKGEGPRLFDLPIMQVDPPVTEKNVNTLGINEQIGVGRSDFSGSEAYRVHNIAAGMARLNGVLVAPGQEFSFNNTVGDINEANGFVKGYAIVENRTQLEFGGGICQDSTTMFRAAFWAGLPITERHPHQFRIPWYDKYALGSLGSGPGMDASIFTGPGGLDFKFLNDTGHWILIQAWSNPRSAVAEIALYGTGNREVQLTHKVYNQKPAIREPQFIADREQPRGRIKRTDTARGGMSIDVYRTVIINGVARDPELFRTVFAPWSDKYAVNPADFGPDGKPLPEVLPESMRPAPTPGPDGTIPGASPQPGDPAQPTPAPVDPAQPQPQPEPQPQPQPGEQPQPAPPPEQPQPTPEP